MSKIVADCDKCGFHIELEIVEGNYKGWEARELNKCLMCESKTKIKFEGLENE